MERLEQKEHDFGTKLRQDSVIGNLHEFIAWQRKLRKSKGAARFPRRGPISINIDLTAACNFACPHCVDSKLIFTREQLTLENIRPSIDTLVDNGLLSVIVIGGGEPTLHKDFEGIVRLLKARRLEVGIATNGSQLAKISRIADVLEEGDWVRLSLDAGSEETFFKSHRPRGNVHLERILKDARALKEKNPCITLGYSFVIVWRGIVVNGHELCPNIDEMAGAVELAQTYAFDYVSFKPCLVRLEGSQKESLLVGPDSRREDGIIRDIRQHLHKAKEAGAGRIKILESVNLQAMLEKRVQELKRQPRVCHAQFFRTVLAPAGIFHCPALRGVAKGKIAENDGYAGDKQFAMTQSNLEQSIQAFDAAQECSEVACFYHHMNWWIENFIQSDKDVGEIGRVEDNNFFL